MTSKRNIIIIAAAAVILAGGAAAVVLTNNAKSTSESVLALAQRYLSEQKYEQAVIEYQKILDIDPMNTEAYLGLAQAYLGMGDTEGAIAALRRGYEVTGDEGLLAKLNSLLPPEETQESPAEEPQEEVQTEETAEQTTGGVIGDDGVTPMFAMLSMKSVLPDGTEGGYIYPNEDGTITNIHPRSDGGILMETIWATNRFGRTDRLVSRIRYKSDGTISFMYRYNEYGDKVEYSNNLGEVTRRTYTYDENGIKLSALETTEYSDGTTETTEITYETTLDEKGRATNIKEYHNGALTAEDTIEYDPYTGIITRYYSEDYDFNTTEEDIFNNRGDMLRMTFVDKENNQVIESEFRYTFDENGNPITEEIYENGELVGVSEYEWQVL